MVNTGIILSSEVKDALEQGKPVVALESTVIAHGLPYPHNIETAKMIEDIAWKNGVVPATIGVVKGKIIVGMSQEEINQMLEDKPLKIGTREIPYTIALEKSSDDGKCDYENCKVSWNRCFCNRWYWWGSYGRMGCLARYHRNVKK